MGSSICDFRKQYYVMFRSLGCTSHFIYNPHIVIPFLEYFFITSTFYSSAWSMINPPEVAVNVDTFEVLVVTTELSISSQKKCLPPPTLCPSFQFPYFILYPFLCLAHPTIWLTERRHLEAAQQHSHNPPPFLSLSNYPFLLTPYVNLPHPQSIPILTLWVPFPLPNYPPILSPWVPNILQFLGGHESWVLLSTVHHRG